MALISPVCMKDCSGDIDTGGTAQWLFNADAAPKAFFLFQNTSDTDMYLEWDDTPATSTKGLKIAAGVAWEAPTPVVFMGRASVLCATTGKTFVCKIA